VVSGSLGKVVGFVGGLPNVKFNNIKEPVVVDYFVWNSEVNKNVAVSQIPLVHAWSISFYTFKKSVSSSINVLMGYHGNVEQIYLGPMLRNKMIDFAPIHQLACMQGANGEHYVYDEFQHDISRCDILKHLCCITNINTKIDTQTQTAVW
jgi:hypothetical protein